MKQVLVERTKFMLTSFEGITGHSGPFGPFQSTTVRLDQMKASETPSPSNVVHSGY
jgi:hypothetical protein